MASNSFTNSHPAPPTADASMLASQLMESVLLVGDLAKLPAASRVAYYRTVCESLRLNPLTKPFEYIWLNGKLTLYATKCCTEQLRARDGISLRITSRALLGTVYVITARATTPAGRRDESTGAVCIDGLKGEALANAYMRAETKAKRRVTLSIAGLGLLDESEIDSVQGARRVSVNADTGEIEASAAGIDTGGHAVGTQEAADHVAQRRIADLKAKAKPDPQMSAMRESLKAAADAIGEQAAAVILQNHGIERLDAIVDLGTGRAVYREMMGYAKSVRKH